MEAGLEQAQVHLPDPPHSMTAPVYGPAMYKVQTSFIAYTILY